MPKISEEKKRQNRNEILRIAKSLFYDYGYNKTSINDIIRIAGISKGRFYTYFKTKEDLFFCLIQGNDQEIIHRGRTLIEDDHNEHTMSDYIRGRLSRFINNEHRIRAKYTIEFWSSTDLDELQKEKLQERYDEFQGDIIAIISIGQGKGIYKKSIDLKAFTHILMSMIDGLIMLDSVLYQPIDENVIEVSIKMINNYLEV